MTNMGKSLVLAGIMIIITAPVMFLFWSASATGGPLGASLIMGGAGAIAALIGAVMVTR